MVKITILYNQGHKTCIKLNLPDTYVFNKINELLEVDKPYLIIQKIPTSSLKYILITPLMTKRDLLTSFSFSMTLFEAENLLNLLTQTGVLYRYHTYWKATPNIIQLCESLNVNVPGNVHKNFLENEIDKNSKENFDFEELDTFDLCTYLGIKAIKFMINSKRFQITQITNFTKHDNENIKKVLSVFILRKYLTSHKTGYYEILPSFIEYSKEYLQLASSVEKPKSNKEILAEEIKQYKDVDYTDNDVDGHADEHPIKKKIKSKKLLTKTEKRIAFLEDMKVNEPFKFGTAELTELTSLKK